MWKRLRNLRTFFFYSLIWSFSLHLPKGFGQEVSTIFYRHLQVLAHDSLEGRGAGTEGAFKAARYIQSQFQQIGILPFQGKYLHPYTLTFLKEPQADQNYLIVGGKKKYFYPEVKPAYFSASGSVKNLKPYFLGYGFKTPRYADYKEVSIKEPFVAIILDGIPPWLDQEMQNYLRPLAFSELKVKWAIAEGANGAIIVVSDEQFQRISYNRLAPKSLAIPVIYISQTFFEKVFSPLRRYSVQKLDPKEWNLKWHYSEISFSVNLSVEEKTDYNVIGYLPATLSSSDSSYIVIGAHYDHLDRGAYGSLADAKERSEIHNGADDNASGVAMMLGVASYFKSQPTRVRPMLFCAWGGEELGLLGSQAFLKSYSSLPISLYVNFDMVGRLKEKLIVQGTGSSPELDSLIRYTPFPIDTVKIELQKDPMLPTDATTFYLNKVPVLSLFTGIHFDYHKPSDDVEKLNLAGMSSIYQYVTTLLTPCVSSSKPVQFHFQQYRDPHHQVSSSRRTGFRIYIGTLPDYSATDIEGMKLAGVSPNSPAEKSGLQKDDIIIQIGKKRIKNIYDYMEVLQTAEPNKPLRVVILRGGKRKRIKVIPRAK